MSSVSQQVDSGFWNVAFALGVPSSGRAASSCAGWWADHRTRVLERRHRTYLQRADCNPKSQLIRVGLTGRLRSDPH
jgi:hypothetical protein